MNQTHFHGAKEPDRSSSKCHFHLNQVFVGVCPLCLNQRLLTLASMKASHCIKHQARHQCSSRGHSFSITTKILSLLNRLELRSHKTTNHFSGHHDCNSESTTQEDSFISIKFEENGAAFWDKDNQSISAISKDLSDQQHSKKKHSSPRGGTLQWRQRIGHIFDNIKRRSASKNG